MTDKSKKVILLTLLISGFLFAAEAQAVAPLVILGAIALVPLILSLVTTVFSAALFLQVVGPIAKFAGQLIDWAISFQNILLDPEKITAIQSTWGILRDFVNIFFILILLVIAFATIFNIKNYKASDLLPKLIIIALLINFSLVATIEIIKLLWIPAAVFLKPLGEGVSLKIANALDTQQFFNPNFVTLIVSGGVSGIVQEVFRAVLLVVNAFLLSWIALILWARIPILIGLMIVSPIAWLGYTIPAIKKQSWDVWWQKLFCWGAIPIPIFGLIYFVVLIHSKLTVEMNQAIPGFFWNTVLPFLGLNVNQTLVWLITVGIFVGGLMYVRTLSCSMYGWVKTGAWGLWGGIRGGVGRAVNFGYGATGAAGAAGTIQKRILEEKGLFGGAAGRQAREGRIEDRLARWVGLKPTYAAQRNTLDQAEKASKDIDNRFKQAKSTAEETVIINELRTKVSAGANDPETLAAINALAKKGQLDVTLFNRAVENFKDTPLALTKVFSEWKEGKFGGIKADELIPILRDARTPLEAKRMGYNFIASEDGKRVVQDKSFDSAAFKGMYETLGGRNTKAGREAKKFVGEINPVVVGKYNYSNPATEFDDPADYPTDEADAILKQIKKTGSKDFTKYNKEIWNDPDFKSALGDLVYNKAITDIGNARKFTEEVRKWMIRESKDEDELRVFNDAATMAGI